MYIHHSYALVKFKTTYLHDSIGYGAYLVSFAIDLYSNLDEIIDKFVLECQKEKEFD